MMSAIGEAPTQEEVAEAEAAPTTAAAPEAAEKGPVEEKGSEEEGPKLRVEDLQSGQELRGVVFKVVKVGAFVDVKAERPGLVPRNKLRSVFTASVQDVVKVGDEVTVWVSEATSDKFILSMVKGKAYAPSVAKRAPISLLEPLVGAEGPGAWLDGTVARCQPWGAFVSVVPPGADGTEEVQGLVHRNEVKAGFFRGSVEQELPIGTKVRVRVLSVDESAGRAAFSMIDPEEVAGSESDGKEEESEEGPFDADLGQFHDIAGLADEWLTGRVLSVAQIGGFVAVRGPAGGEEEARGFLHMSQIREGFVSDARRELEVGQEVRVRVTKVQLDDHKLFLSMKEDSPDAMPGIKKAPPSAEDAARFADLVGGDQWLLGKVDGVADFGAFVEVTHPSGEGAPITGLVHVTELSDGIVASVRDFVDIGQEVRVRVKACDPASGKVAFSMKQPGSGGATGGQRGGTRDLSAFKDLPSDLWLTGTIKQLLNFGVVAEVPAPSGAAEGGTPGQGLVHISQVANRFVEDVAEIVEVGQVVQVRVLGVDEERGRLSLSMIDPEPEDGEQDGEVAEQEEEG